MRGAGVHQWMAACLAPKTILTIWLCALLSLTACSPKYDNSLPDSSELGSPRGLRIARIITHFHSPYSHDGCDRAGFAGGVINKACLTHVKHALCNNRIDFLFLTDHPTNMASFEMADLLLKEENDELLYKGGLPYANRVGNCESSFKPTILVGFEDRLMTLGMEKHLSDNADTRLDLYKKDTSDIRSRLQTETNALVAIPHTESRTVAEIQATSPDAIEIYNIHANLDPKIRKRDLGVPPFENLPSIITYLIDPYSTLVPDFMFIGFLKVHPVYASKWDELIASGLRITGIGGTDSHENIFPQKTADDERLDSHRRLTRFMSNHYLVDSLDPDSVKTALKKGRGWLVFEGLGSPVGMDLYAVTSSGTVTGVGEQVSLGGSSATIVVKAPSLHRRSPAGDENPTFRLELRKVLSGGSDTAVASSDGSDINYSTTSAGAYRVEISIVPRHLKEFLGPFSDKGDESFPWIISNHVYLEP